MRNESECGKDRHLTQTDVPKSNVCAGCRDATMRRPAVNARCIDVWMWEWWMKSVDVIGSTMKCDEMKSRGEERRNESGGER